MCILFVDVLNCGIFVNIPQSPWSNTVRDETCEKNETSIYCLHVGSGWPFNHTWLICRHHELDNNVFRANSLIYVARVPTVLIGYRPSTLPHPATAPWVLLRDHTRRSCLNQTQRCLALFCVYLRYQYPVSSLSPIWRFHVQKREEAQERHGQIVWRLTYMLTALVASIHKTIPPGDQVLEVLAVCCLPQLLGQTA